MFGYPELVAQLVPYLLPQDLARCSATCKSFASLFGPYLYQQVTLEDEDPVPPALTRYLQHVRILRIHSHDVEGCLEALAGVLDSTETTSTQSATADPPRRMTNLQKLTVINTAYPVSLEYSTVALDTVINILNNNSGITHLELQMYTDLEGSSIDPRLLDIIRTGLPRLERFIVSGTSAFSTVQAVEAIKICLGHPSLTDVQFETYAERYFCYRSGTSDHKALFESLLMFLDGVHKAGAQLQEVDECRLTSLALPYIGGYPQSFLLPLLRTYLPKLERLQVPILDGPYGKELEEVIAGHCSNLCHIAYNFPVNEWDQNSSVIKAAIRGCARWNGLKSIRIFGYKHESDTDSGRGLVETLVDYHSKTLESVELQPWNYRGGAFLLGPIFTGCPNLKSLKVLPIDKNMRNSMYMYFSHLPAEPWVFQGLKELRLHFSQNEQYPGAERANHELEAGGKVFEQIGKLIYLEFLAFDYFGDSDHAKDDRSIEASFMKEIAGLEKLRYLYMPLHFWDRRHLSAILDSSWPRLERISARHYDPMDFRWIKERRPWLIVEDLE